MTRVFGYGSLVNRNTQGFGGEHHILPGWQRVWVTTAARPAAFLSVEPMGSEIEGLLFSVPDASWPDLLAREAQYDQIDLGEASVLFQVPEVNKTSGHAPILRSYLDVVMQGYATEFGDDGLKRFMATTHSWERGILDDRANPIYPRAQTLSPAEQEHFDALTASVPKVEKLK